MTTERELREWQQKIRRVRGQKPKPVAHRSTSSVWHSVLIFFCGLAIAVYLSHYRQQQVNTAAPQPPLKALPR